jgi:serine/threonine protein kinase
MNFQNEALFQLYANQLNIDFISPELYSWGIVDKYCFPDDLYRYKCLYLIMEYIPHITLKEASFTPDHIKQIYERVANIDNDMKASLLHHNDLHSGNIMVTDTSPLPEIVILDFGEASYGPRKSIGGGAPSLIHV